MRTRNKENIFSYRVSDKKWISNIWRALMEIYKKKEPILSKKKNKWEKREKETSSKKR